MRLILARHGETESNRDQLALGRLDVPLNDTGCLQAKALASVLREAPIAAVYSSPLVRARATAEAIAAEHGLSICVEDGLTEMDVGEMDGHAIPEMMKLHAGFLKRWFGPEAGTLRMPGGECLQDVQDRAWDAVQGIMQHHADDLVCAVTHNFTIHVLLCRVLGLPLSDFRRFRHDLAAVSIVDLSLSRTALVCLNDTCHLDREGLAERPFY